MTEPVDNELLEALGEDTEPESKHVHIYRWLDPAGADIDSVYCQDWPECDVTIWQYLAEVGDKLTAVEAVAYGSTTSLVVQPPYEYKTALANFANLDLQRRALKDRLKRVEWKRKDIMDYLLEEYVEMGQSSARVTGLTIHTYSQLWAGAVRDENDLPDYETTNAALEEAGLGDLVQPRFNVQTLSAYIRELPRDELGNPLLPPELEGRVRITRTTELRTRKFTSR